MKSLLTIGLLIISNIVMTIAWYGHLKFNSNQLTLPLIILISWGIAFFEYCFQVPANRIGFEGNGGPFNMWQLKVIQEAISLIVFSVFAVVCFKSQRFTYNHLIGFALLILAVYFIFKK